MLVISRKNGQKIMLNDNIIITVLDSKSGICKLAIEADKDVKIYREEVYYKIKLANFIGKEAGQQEVNSISEILKNKSLEVNTTDTSSTGKTKINLKRNKENS